MSITFREEIIITTNLDDVVPRVAVPDREWSSFMQLSPLSTGLPFWAERK